MFIFLISPFLSLAFVAYVLLYTRFWWLMSIYLVWLYFDWDIGERGSRPLNWYRNHWIWKRMADYFPVDLIKTTDLPANKNYIFWCVFWNALLIGLHFSEKMTHFFSCHPHGLLSVAPFVNFCTNGTNFSEKFPGIQSYPATLAGQFYFPFRREVIISLGVIAASARGITAILKKAGGGNAVCLIVGGAEEVWTLRRPKLSWLIVIIRSVPTDRSTLPVSLYLIVHF